MSKQEIQALIAKGIAGQGSAIDVGGVLPAILNGILDLAGSEPLIIEGEVAYAGIGYRFTPHESQPSFDEAEAFYKNGGTVILKHHNSGTEEGVYAYSNITGIGGGQLIAYGFNGTGGSAIYW